MLWERDRYVCQGEKIVYLKEADSGAEMMDTHTQFDIIPGSL